MMSDREWLAEAYVCALQSKDPSTQNGAALVGQSVGVIATACNQIPHNVAETPERYQRPLKYEVIEHAERNAIFGAAYHGYATRNATLYCAWAACSDCARAIIQAGIIRLVRHRDATVRGQGRNWDGSIAIADVMMIEAGVEITDIEGKVTDGLTLLHSGEEWSP